jgi:hypothetical protein
MSSKPKAAAKASWPWHPVNLEGADADIFALQALANGIANEGQQKRALEFILQKVCEVDRLEFWPGGGDYDGRRATDFSGGKRFVGLQIRRVLRMKPTVVNPRGAPPAMPAETPAVE